MIFWLLLACGGSEEPSSAPAAEAADGGLTIAYSHNVSGEIEPCG